MFIFIYFYQILIFLPIIKSELCNLSRALCLLVLPTPSLYISLYIIYMYIQTRKDYYRTTLYRHIQQQFPMTPLHRGLERPPHIIFNHMLSHTDDLTTRPYEIATITILYHSSISILRLGCCRCSIRWGWHHQATLDTRAPSQYKDRLIYVWRFPC